MLRGFDTPETQLDEHDPEVAALVVRRKSRATRLLQLREAGLTVQQAYLLLRMTSASGFVH